MALSPSIPALCSATEVSSLPVSFTRSSFFTSTRLLCGYGVSARPVRMPLITARIKWRKELSFDNVIQRQKKLKVANKIKDLLVKQAGMVMSLRDLGKHRRHLGLRGRRRCVSLLRKYPAVFEIFEEGVCSLYFRFTPAAEEQFVEELRIRKEMEETLVEKLRKLLMMSIDKRILITKICHIARDLGLPTDFRQSILPNYPQFFKIVETEAGPALELTHWDPKLAVTAYEKKKEEEKRLKEEASDEETTTISGRVPKFRTINLPKGLNVSRKDKQKLVNFMDMPFISPYEDFTQLDPSSPEAEKHAVAVIHEFLTLMLEKRTLIDHLTHFRSDFKFSQRVYAMIIRHPEFFYVSLKGDRHSVFLREAYKDSQLIEKDPLVLAKDRLAELVTAARKRGRPLPGSDDEQDDEDDDEEDLEDGALEDDDWSDSEDENTNGVSDNLQVEDVRSQLKAKQQQALREFREANRQYRSRGRELTTTNPTPRERW